MLITNSTTTRDVLAELGTRLRAYRLQQNTSVMDVARSAGLGTATILRAELGRGMTLANLVRLLRALGRLDALDAFLPAPTVSPIQLAALNGHERQRAGSPRPRQRHKQATARRSARRK